MSLNLELVLEKDQYGTYGSHISCKPTDGGGAVAAASFLDATPLIAVCKALDCILYLTPNLDQDEFTKALKERVLIEWPDEPV